MSKDLEEQLKELGPDGQSVVARLRAAKSVEPRGERLARTSRSTAEWLVAASFLLALGLTVPFLTSRNSNVQTLSSYGAREYHQTVTEMIATQNPDGSWQNDFLTRRNAGVLSRCEGAAARIAYKKALRNLRSKGGCVIFSGDRQ